MGKTVQKPLICKKCNADLSEAKDYLQFDRLCIIHHREKQRLYKAQRRSSGRCHDCGKKVEIDSPVKSRCKKCYIKYRDMGLKSLKASDLFF